MANPNKEKPKIGDFCFSPHHAEHHAEPGVAGEFYKKDGCIWWKMPPPAETPTRVIEAKDATYGRLPLARVRVTDDNRKTSDTAAILGGLENQAREVFSKQEPIHFTFYPKITNSGEWLRFPEKVERFIPAIAPILLTERANLMPPELWDYCEPSIRISCGWVKPGENARKVEQTTGVFQTWHDHGETARRNPNPQDHPAMMMGEYVISDRLPTIVSDGHKVMDGAFPPPVNEDHFIIEPEGRSTVRRAVKDVAAALPYYVVQISPLTAHNSEVNVSNQPVFRNFMRVFFKLDRNALKEFGRDYPDLMEKIPRERPEYMRVSSGLER